MTQKLYYEDVYLKEFDASVLCCRKREKEERWEIIPDRSAFYPEGGGQSGDQGSLTVEGSGEMIRVLDTREDGDQIVLLCDRPVDEGARIHAQIDWEYRFDRMQNHSGEHIVSGLIHTRFGYNNVGFHMSGDRMTIDLDGEIPDEAFREIERRANEIVWSDVPVRTDLYTEEQAQAVEFRSKKELHGEIRVVSIPGADVCACCGTHVSHTGEIGPVLILSHERFKGGTRMEMTCGRWAYNYLSEVLEQNHQVSVLLSSKTLETASYVQKVLDDQAQMKSEIIRMHYEQIERMADELSQKGDVLIFAKQFTPVLLQKLAARVMEKTSFQVFAFSGDDAEGYRYAVGRTGGDLKEFVKEMNAQLHGRGGGKPFFLQGSVSSDRKNIENYVSDHVEKLIIVDM